MKFWRINLILVLIILFGATLIGRLVFLQILKHDFYKALAEGQQKFFIEENQDRGKIYFKNYELPLTTNHLYPLVFLSPHQILPSKRKEISAALSSILDLKQNFILEKIKKNSLYTLLKNKLNEREVRQIKKAQLPGVYLGEEKRRNYPQGEFASHLLGFVNLEGRGQYGIEEYWDEVLTEGRDLVLSVDYNIQYQAEKLLQRAKHQFNIAQGQIIVVEPQSGKILALAHFPRFNPNRYSEYAKIQNLEIFKNGAIQSIFEPGSVFKSVTMAIALDQGKITPQTTYVDKGYVKVGKDIIYNYGGRRWGKRNMIEVLEKSINTGAVFVEQKIPHPTFLNYLDLFGIFEKTGVDLAGEVFSENTEFKKGYEINFTTASFGQGIEMTPLQLLRVFCAIANGGKLVRPQVVEKIVKDGKITEVKSEEISSENIISSKTASQLTAMMISVIENGFAKRAGIPGYYIAGKTGTAQIPWSGLGIDKPGYSEKTVQSFIGFAPAFNPQFLILVKLNNPATKTAEYSAAPLFHDLAKYIIDYYQIPPDYEISK